MFNIITYDDLHKLLHEPEWKSPALYAMTDVALIQELERRGYVIKQLERKSGEQVTGKKSE